MSNLTFWKGKRVFVTGHTGFIGAWLCKTLIHRGAIVTGFSSEPGSNRNLYEISKLDTDMNTEFGDIRNVETLNTAFQKSRAEIVFHLAGIVNPDYSAPLFTYEVNVLGTLNIVECVRKSDYARSLLHTSTERVCLNREWGFYEEKEPKGFYPYSNSKLCSEIVVHGYGESFLKDKNTAVSIVRPGNIIGGGDFETKRILPYCIHSAIEQSPIVIWNPELIYSYNHVLDTINVYLMIAQKQCEDMKYMGCYSIGQDESGYITNGELVDLFCREWGGGLSWKKNPKNIVPDKTIVPQSDCLKLKTAFGWKLRWTIDEAVIKTVEWMKVYIKGGNVSACMDKQIDEFYRRDNNEGI